MSPSISTRLLLLLLLADAGFVVLHLLEDFGPFWRKAFRMDQDNSLAEFFQYSKTVGSAICLGLLARQFRSMLLWVACGLAVFLFLDDSLRIHELLGGGVIGEMVTGEDSPEGYHLGQIWYAAAVGVVVLAVFVLAWRGGSPVARRVTAGFLVFVAALGFAAVVIDSIPTTLIDAPWFRPAIGLVEEVGEHLAMTGMVWWCVKSWLTLGPGRSGSNTL